MGERVTCGICRWAACALRKPRSMRVARVVAKACVSCGERVTGWTCARCSACVLRKRVPYGHTTDAIEERCKNDEIKPQMNDFFC